MPRISSSVSLLAPPLTTAPVTGSTSSINAVMLGAAGASVSTLMVRVPAGLVLPAVSVAVALRVSLPCPIAAMSAAANV